MKNKNNFFLKELTVQLIKSRKTKALLSQIRTALPSNSYGNLVDELDKQRTSRSSVTNGNKGRSVRDLDVLISMKGLDIEGEIKWGKAVISRSHNILNLFLRLSREFDENFMQSNFDKCEMLLDQIENSFGPSLWLIKNKIAFLQFRDGLEAQKNYVQKIKFESKYKGFVGFISHWVSIRNEETVTASKFISQFETVLARDIRSIEEGYEPYLRYHILGQEDLSIDEVVHLLRLEFPRSLIDYYEIYITVSRIICLRGDERQKNHLVYSLKKIVSKIPDVRLLIVLKLLNQDVQVVDNSKKTVECYDLFLLGKYENCYEKATEFLKDEPINSVLIYLAALAKSMDENLLESYEEIKSEKDPQKLFIKGLSEIIKYGPIASSIHSNDVNKLALNFSSMTAMIAPLTFIGKEYFENKTSYSTAFASLRLGYFDPFLIPEFIDLSILEKYIIACHTLDYKTLSFEYSLSLVRHKNLISSDAICYTAKVFVQGVNSYFNGLYDGSFEFSNKLIESKRPFYVRQGYRLKSYSLLKLGEYKDLCLLIVELHLTSSSNYSILPIEEFVKKLSPDSDEWNKLKSILDLSILLDIYTKHFSREIESYRAYALEDFLDSRNVSRPSELINYMFELDEKRLSYFLQYICIEPIIDMTTAYESPNEVASERLKVCKLLAVIDEQNKDEYDQEAKEIVRRVVIEQKMKEIDESRIYIDVEKVKQWSIKELSESYKRYTEYLKHGLDLNIIAQQEDAKAKVAEQDAEGLLSMEIPKNEVTALFEHMSFEIRDAYTSNPEFGLNRYISTRIRHGVIESQLRRPLDVYHLITQKEGERGDYKSNIYWLNQLSIDSRQAKKIDQAFWKFSSSYDDLINEIKSSWLQVARRPNERGMFNFMLKDGELVYLASKVTSETPLKKFVEIVIDYLNERLEGGLGLIRSNLTNLAKKRAITIMNSLQKNVSSIANLTSLDASINLARTDIQGVFDRIVEWFVPSHSVGYTPYNIKDAISVAEAIVIQAFPQLEVNVSIEEDDTEIEIQGALPTFVDIMVNIFENVVKRSELDQPTAQVLISITDNRIVHIEVRNLLGNDINVNDRRQELIDRKELLEKSNYDEYISREGKSGFFKIHKSLKDFKTVEDLIPILNFGIEENEFFIKITIPFTLRSVKENQLM